MFADPDYDQSALIIAQISKHLREFRNHFQRIMEHGTPDDFIRSVFNNDWGGRFGYESKCDYRGALNNIFTANSPVTYANKKVLYTRTAYYLNQIIEAFETLEELVGTNELGIGMRKSYSELSSYDIEVFSKDFIDKAKEFLCQLEKGEVEPDNIKLVIQHRDFSFIRKNDEEEKLFTSLYYSNNEGLIPTSLGKDDRNLFLNISKKNTFIWAYRGFIYQMLMYNNQGNPDDNRDILNRCKGEARLTIADPLIALDIPPEKEKNLLYGLKEETLKDFKKYLKNSTDSNDTMQKIQKEFKMNRATLWWAIYEIVKWDLSELNSRSNEPKGNEDSKLFEFPGLKLKRNLPDEIQRNDKLLYILLELLMFDYSSNDMDNIITVSRDSSTPEIYIGFRTSCYTVLNALKLYRLLSIEGNGKNYTYSTSKLEEFIENNLKEIINYWKKNPNENLYLMSLFLRVLTVYLLIYPDRKKRLMEDVEQYIKKKEVLEIKRSTRLLDGNYAKPILNPENESGKKFEERVNAVQEKIISYIDLNFAECCKRNSKRKIRPYNVFICGAPGTGKTFLAEQIINSILANYNWKKTLFQVFHLNLSSDLARDATNKSLEQISPKKIKFFIIDETDTEHVEWNQYGYFLEPMWETKMKRRSIDITKGVLVNFFIGSKYFDIKTFENEMFNRNAPIKSKDFNSRLYDKIEIPATINFEDRIINGCIVIKKNAFEGRQSVKFMLEREILIKIGNDESSDFKRNIEKDWSLIKFEDRLKEGYYIFKDADPSQRDKFILIDYK